MSRHAYMNTSVCSIHHMLSKEYFMIQLVGHILRYYILAHAFIYI